MKKVKLFIVALVVIFVGCTPLVAQSPLPRIYLPMVNYAAAADPRYQAWYADETQALSVDLGYANIISRLTVCVSCKTQRVGDTQCARAVTNAQTYKGRLYILGDEPDTHGVEPVDYLAWYRPCREGILSADPTARVAWAGISSMGGLDYASRLLAAAGTTAPTDQLRFHVFAVVGHFTEWQDYIGDWVEWRNVNMPNVPLALGSFGYPGTPESDERVVPETYAAMEWLRSTPLESWAWWSWYREQDDHVLWRNGALTPVGEAFRDAATWK